MRRMSDSTYTYSLILHCARVATPYNGITGYLLWIALAV